MVLLLCLTFIGQAMASTVMSYHMISMSGMNGQSQDMPMMVHSDHNMANASSSDLDESSEDCCAKTCLCFTGGCSNVAALIKYAGSSTTFESSKILSYSHLIQSQKPTSLYRPPILS